MGYRYLMSGYNSIVHIASVIGLIYSLFLILRKETIQAISCSGEGGGGF